jgi:DNA-binding NarL/FixJ family response regulator
MPYSILIVEDDPQFRLTFADAVNSAADLRLAGVADDLPEGLRLLDQTKPDILLVDIGLPSGSGIELIRHAHEHLPASDVMVVTVFGDERHVLECIEAGATGYLLKDTQRPDIVEQIRTLREGGSPISPVIARRLLTRFRTTETPAAPESVEVEPSLLSAQERSVLDMSAKGYSYEEIAGLLGLSRHTVETYIKRIYRKLQVHSKSEAIYEARQLGLLRD